MAVNFSFADPRLGVAPARCPGCASLLNAATNVADEEARPQPGDRTFCIHCGAGLEFVDGGGVRPLTLAEFEETIRELTPAERHVLNAMADRRRARRTTN
jgi:hypothetical protein